MKYVILCASSKTLLEEKIEEHIKKGWIPQGGIAFDEDGWPHQAMILPAPTPQ